MKKLKDLTFRVSFISILINIILFIFKLITGIIGRSSAMISDSIHSLSDVISTFVVIIGVLLARKKPDHKHQYGHERFESLAALILALILIFTGIYIGYEGLISLLKNKYNNYDITYMALIGALVSIVVKEWMYHYTIKAANKVNSGALKADAWHHRSDALSSIGALIGIAGSILGFKFLDPIASFAISICIVKASVDIMKDSFDKMLDVAANDDVELLIKEIVCKENGIFRIDDLKTRLFGNKIYIDIEIAVDGNLKLKDAHDIAQKVHDKIEKEIETCKHCMVHVNPFE